MTEEAKAAHANLIAACKEYARLTDGTTDAPATIIAVQYLDKPKEANITAMGEPQKIAEMLVGLLTQHPLLVKVFVAAFNTLLARKKATDSLSQN